MNEVTFWHNIAQLGPYECWNWTSRCGVHAPGSTLRYGLAYVSVMSPRGKASRLEMAHRVAWELANGPIQLGAWVLHSCDNSLCCNPAHLRLGDSVANEADKTARNRHPRGGRTPGIVLPRRDLPTRSGPRHWNAKLTDAQVREIRDRYFGDVNLTAAALRREYRLSVPGITRILRGLSRVDAGGPTGLIRPIVGEAVTVTGKRATTAMVPLIRAAYEAGGTTIYALAKRHGISPQTISKICRRDSWKHVSS